jgi:hypothetical protein
VGISAKVLKDTLNPIEGRLAINNPLFTIERAPESFKVLRRLEMPYTVGESKGTRFEASFKKIKELPFEQRRHHPDGDEKPFAG